MSKTMGFVVALGLLLAGAVPTAAQSSDAVELFDYEVQRGDTCIGIARRVYGQRNAYKLIHEHNRDLGPLPHRLKPGQILRLPRPGSGERGADAHLTGKNGPVRFREPAREAWDAATEGMELFRAWRVNARKRAFAELTFRDASKLYMRQNTIVIIYGASSRRARRVATEAQLEHGTLRTRLAELDGAPRLRVKTPSSESELGAGSALVSVDDAGMSRIANHRGDAVAVRSRDEEAAAKRKRKRRRRRKVDVAVGMGTRVERGKEPEAPRPLPAAPAWSAGDGRFVGWSGVGGTIRAAWSPVDKAVSYRLEIAKDPDAASVIGAVTASATGFEAHGLPAGTYYVRIASIDGDGLEGAPSEPLELQVVELKLAAPDGSEVVAATAAPVENEDEAGPDLAAAPTLVPLAIGTRVMAPAETRCAAGQGEASAELVLVTAGRQSVRCIDDAGRALAPAELLVAGLRAQLETGGAELQRLPREVETVVSIALSSDAALPGAYRVRGPEGVAIGEVHSGPHGALRVAVRPGPEVAERFDLQVLPHSPEIDVVLATVSVAVEPRAEPVVEAPLPLTPGPPPIELGFFAGAAHFDDDLALGANAEPSWQLSSSAVLGARAAYRARPRLAVEGELALAPTRWVRGADDDPTHVVSWRAHLRVPLLAPTRSTRPFAVAGVGGATVLARPDGAAGRDSELAGHWGVGLEHGLLSKTALRLDFRHLVTDARGSARFAHVFEAHVGFVWRLGSP